ncbi:MAG: hypothetical protein QXT63_03275 [Thermoplasmata archaeon]
MDYKRDGEGRAIIEDIAKSQKIRGRCARELYKSSTIVKHLSKPSFPSFGRKMQTSKRTNFVINQIDPRKIFVAIH